MNSRKTLTFMLKLEIVISKKSYSYITPKSNKHLYHSDASEPTAHTENSK